MSPIICVNFLDVVERNLRHQTKGAGPSRPHSDARVSGFGAKCMNLRALRYFRAVAECGSFSRGSALLHVSQPAVSRMIRQLEDELGRPLFTRNSDGAALTEAGRLLFERSRSLLQQLEQTVVEIRSGEGADVAGMITVALPPGVGHLLAPPLIERFSAKYPNVAVKCTGGYSNQLYEALIRGRVDVAFIHDPVPRRDMEVVPLVKQEVFVVGKAGSFPKRGDLSGEDLEKLSLILPTAPNTSRKLLDAWAAAGGSWIDPKFEIDDHIIMSGLIKRGLGFGVMTQATIGANLRLPGVETRSLAPKAYWSLAVAYFKSRMVSDPQRDFIAMTITMVEQMKAAGEWSGGSAESLHPRKTRKTQRQH